MLKIAKPCFEVLKILTFWVFKRISHFIREWVKKPCIPSPNCSHQQNHIFRAISFIAATVSALCHVMWILKDCRHLKTGLFCSAVNANDSLCYFIKKFTSCIPNKQDNMMCLCCVSFFCINWLERTCWDYHFFQNKSTSWILTGF